MLTAERLRSLLNYCADTAQEAHVAYMAAKKIHHITGE
ncbi:hypothetical protein FEP07_04793 [Burkholderia multivorans]|nr:hypothetical protein [Burkholderia multivorans]MDR9266447.1 hypothetical protein [Burkholderia multivorans]MDR9287334.1 hypothetical protein [Burkholderia multivorans]MDR9289958.1 hypothetical protein [Burkholderia multivorans]MDR9312659.1 hypothetical protein [Burkholderia multivorans]